MIGLIVVLVFSNCNQKSETYEPDNTVWEDLIGIDTTIGFWPDRYANYFAYTFKLTEKDLCFKISGRIS